MQQLSGSTGLDADRMLVNDYLGTLLDECATGTGRVQQAVRYAVLGAGQRIRPILSLRIARVLNAPIDATLRAAASIELLHCASLIVDDLPCMDDSSLRRNEPSVHIRFGEAAAVLAAFALVSLAARVLTEASSDDGQRRRFAEFQIQLLRTLDCSSLIAGQALDLKLDQVAYATPSDIFELKTVPLFRLAVLAGALFADPSARETTLLCRFASEFGMAFQMIDDALDGECVDHALLDGKFTMLRDAIEPFGSSSRELHQLVSYLEARVCQSVQV